jgi:transcriptional regulator with XRE-family HTH domain
MDIKQDFARRLVAALDYAKVSTRPVDRKRYLAHIAGVTERHAGNYLSGEKMPTTEGMIDLAIRLGVAWEWLATGRGTMLSIGLTPEETSTIQALSTKDRERLFQIGQVLAHPKSGEQAAPIAA